MYPRRLKDYVINEDIYKAHWKLYKNGSILVVVDSVKISPEGLSYPDHRMRTKVCHRFAHEKYDKLTSVFCGLELSPDLYELKLKEFL